MPRSKADQTKQSVELADIWADPPVEELGATVRTLSNKAYLRELSTLQIELVKLQEWIRHTGMKVVVVFEGRDAAGKGGAIKTVTLSLNRGTHGLSLSARRPSARSPSGTSSATLRTCRRPARWSCSIEAGTTGLASSG